MEPVNPPAVRIVINLAYLAASVLFIMGIILLSRPKTAVRGNWTGAAGMLLAIVATMLDRHIIGYGAIAGGLAVGATLGAIFAYRIKMTAMPQGVAVLNGLGGGASVLVAGAALIEASGMTDTPGLQMVAATVVSGIIGSVTFSGSLIAFGKLQGFVSEKSIHYPGQKVLNSLIAMVCLAMGAWLIAQPEIHGPHLAYWILVLVSLFLGILLTLPIGGADMPVAVALLNSYSGLAAAATGFVLSNNALIIGGSLVGASGIILTRIMCKAMNRSLTNVLFGVLGEEGVVASADEVYAGKVKSASAEDVALLLDGARRVMIVPGYGMAVAQAQHAVRELATVLAARGTEVDFAIHPVAGRMPGHMNVLLAEANIEYDRLKEMNDANPMFPETDVAIVIGANDVVNPVANSDPKSPIAGMPILEVDKARTVVVVKRSLSPGFAGIPNPLFAADNTLMFFADGKKAILELITAIKEL